MNRGDVYWHELRSPDKVRPVVVITADRHIRRLNAVAVASITTTIRHVPSEVVLGPDDGMREPCAVNLHQLWTATKAELQHKITTLSPRRMEEIRQAAIYVLGLEEPDEFAL